MIYLLSLTALFCVCNLILTMIQSGFYRAIHKYQQYYLLETLYNGRQQHSSVMSFTMYNSKWEEWGILSFLHFSHFVTNPFEALALGRFSLYHLLVTVALNGRPVTWQSYDEQRHTEKEGTRLIEARNSQEDWQKCPPEVVFS